MITMHHEAGITGTPHIQGFIQRARKLSTAL